MFRTVSLLVSILFASVFLAHEGFAAITYTPADKLFLTGTTGDTRFDVASALHGSSFSGAYLDTTNKELEGAFYMNGIGWALMSSGSLQVTLDCGAQSLASLTSQCQFSGSGWSENIGEVGFQNVRYNPSTATLSGSITSFAGNFTVEGIVLPLRRTEFNEPLASLTANHALSLTTREAGKYPHIIGGGSWSLELRPTSDMSELRSYAGGIDGSFVPDVSLADTYTLEVTDPQGSTTTYDSVVVSPGSATQTLDSTVGIFVDSFCTSHPGMCPDGAVRQATRLDKSTSTPTPTANGIDTHNFVLKLRDTYGNRVTTGTVEVSYTGTVSNVQIPANILSPYGAGNLKDAFIFNGDVFPLGWDGSGNWNKSFPVVGGTDISYTLASTAPTDTTDNRIILNTIQYTPPVGPTQTITDSTYLEFDKPYTATLNPPTSLQVAATNVFDGTFVSAALAPTNPELITLFKIGSGNLAYFNNLTMGTTSTEESPSNDWMVDLSTTSHVASSSPSSIFSLTGTYMPTTAYPELETVYYEGFVHYMIGTNDVVYPVFSGDRASEYLASKVKILGQNNARSEYGTIGTDSSTRASFVNALRKNISLMNRGRTTYTDVDYRVSTANISVQDGDFTNHRTIIAIGADITITENVSKRDGSLAIIALADEQGNGGNIIIEDDVTDIYAGLFAERAVLTTGTKDKQLYIYGALVSGNTLGETAAGICPYYVTSCTHPEHYDLEYLRTYDGTDTAKASTNPRASEYPGSALIIEYDMRLQSDPPPGLPG